jgi:hypothetical protein
VGVIQESVQDRIPDLNTNAFRMVRALTEESEGDVKRKKQATSASAQVGWYHKSQRTLSGEAPGKLSPAIPVDVIGSDLWTAHAYGALSVAYRVSAALQRQANVINLAGKIWRLDRILASLLNDIYTGAENPKPNPGPVSTERIHAAIETLHSLHRAVERLYTSLLDSGLANRTLIGTPTNSLRSRADDLLDIAEAIELSMNPAINDVFEESLEELHRGEAFDLSALG